MNWKKIEDGLPEESCKVVCYSTLGDHPPLLANYYSTPKVFCSERSDTQYFVLKPTHYIELPAYELD